MVQEQLECWMEKLLVMRKTNTITGRITYNNLNKQFNNIKLILNWVLESDQVLNSLTIKIKGRELKGENQKIMLLWHLIPEILTKKFN